MFNYMYKILMIAIPIIIICFFMNNVEIDNKSKDTQNEYYIHSSELNKSFLVKDLSDDKISEIQLSLNKRDN